MNISLLSNILKNLSKVNVVEDKFANEQQCAITISLHLRKNKLLNLQIVTIILYNMIFYSCLIQDNLRNK